MDNVHEIWTIEKKIILSMDRRRPWTIVHETYKTQKIKIKWSTLVAFSKGYTMQFEFFKINALNLRKIGVKFIAFEMGNSI